MSAIAPVIHSATTALQGTLNSPLKVLGNIASGGLYGEISAGLAGAKTAVNEIENGAPKPNVQTNPTTSMPNQPQASTTAIQTQLSNEQNARSTGSILTSAAGLNDTPQTTSSLLTGT